MQEHTSNAELEPFRAFGYFALLAAAFSFLLFLANIRARLYYGGPNFSWLGYVAAYAFMVGRGLVRMQKWAVVSFAVPLCLIGVVVGVSAVAKQPDIRTGLLAAGWAAVLSAPAMSVIRRWRSFKQPTVSR